MVHLSEVHMRYSPTENSQGGWGQTSILELLAPWCILHQNIRKIPYQRGKLRLSLQTLNIHKWITPCSAQIKKAFG